MSVAYRIRIVLLLLLLQLCSADQATRRGAHGAHTRTQVRRTRHARTHDAPTRAPQEWLDQLSELGAFDPRANTVQGGHGVVVERWARAERLDLDEWVAALRR